MLRWQELSDYIRRDDPRYLLSQLIPWVRRRGWRLTVTASWYAFEGMDRRGKWSSVVGRIKQAVDRESSKAVIIHNVRLFHEWVSIGQSVSQSVLSAAWLDHARRRYAASQRRRCLGRFRLEFEVQTVQCPVTATEQKAKPLFSLMPWLQLRFKYDTTVRSDYDVSRAPASIRRDSTRAKNEHVNIFRRIRIVVESQLWYRLKLVPPPHYLLCLVSCTPACTPCLNSQ